MSPLLLFTDTLANGHCQVNAKQRTHNELQAKRPKQLSNSCNILLFIYLKEKPENAKRKQKTEEDGVFFAMG